MIHETKKERSLHAYWMWETYNLQIRKISVRGKKPYLSPLKENAGDRITQTSVKETFWN